MLKTNVIKKPYEFLVRNKEDNTEEEITVLAESLESAKLKMPDEYEILKVIGEPK